MLTERENFLETIKKDGNPDRLVNCYTAFKPIVGDPVFQFVRGNCIRGTYSYDRWGTYIAFPEDQPAATPCDEIYTLEAGHSPYFSKYQELAEVLMKM